jgi:hypothetical protein
VVPIQWQWQRIELPRGGTVAYNPAGERQVFAIQFDPQDRICIANRYNGQGDEVILRSADAGVTWQKIIHRLDDDCWM